MKKESTIDVVLTMESTITYECDEEDYSSTSKDFIKTINKCLDADIENLKENFLEDYYLVDDDGDVYSQKTKYTKSVKEREETN